MKTESNIKSWTFFVFDLSIVVVSYLSIVWWQATRSNHALAYHDKTLLYFGIVWCGISLIMKKYCFKKEQSLKNKSKFIFITNAVILALTMSGMRLLHIIEHSKTIVSITISTITILEIVMVSFLYAYKQNNKDLKHLSKSTTLNKSEQEDILNGEIKTQLTPSNNEDIVSLQHKKISNFIKEHIPFETDKILFVDADHPLKISNGSKQHKAIVNLHKLNSERDINALFKDINESLPKNGLHLTLAETIATRKKRILTTYPPLLNKTIYFIDYLYHRVFAKSHPTKHIYNWLGNKNRAISKTELLGRLYACGFEVVTEQRIDNLLVCISRKNKQYEPISDESTGGLIKLKRLGKERKLIEVYKFRTMHPYSEYLQAYIYDKNDLADGGKINNDFRITSLGKYMRKMWIDELPMIMNVLKGDMALIGVRPLSAHYFGLYTEELQKLRTKFKPGLLPPFYADMPITLDEIIASELAYLRAYEKKPLRTKAKYFFKILNNIIIKKQRSK